MTACEQNWQKKEKIELPESVQLTILSQYQLIKWLCEYEQSDKGTRSILSNTSGSSSSSLVTHLTDDT